MNLHRLIELIKRLDLPEAGAALDDALTQVVGAIQYEIRVNEWPDSYKLRNMIRDADRLQELSETLSLTETY